MKKIFKICITILLTLICVVNLFACGDNGDSQDNPEIIEPISISLSTNNVSLNVGEIHYLHSIIYPSNANQNVIYSCLNEDIAKIDSQGKITAIKKGSTVVIAEASNGLKAMCDINITVATGNLEGFVTYSVMGNLSVDYNDYGAVIQLIPVDITSFPSTYKYLSGNSNYEEYGIYTATTDTSGNYKFDNIPIGTYRVITRSGNAKVNLQTETDRKNNVDEYIDDLYGDKIGYYVKSSLDILSVATYFGYNSSFTTITITKDRTITKSFTSFIDFQ